MVYVRADHRYPCACGYDPSTKSPISTCQDCFGLGFKVQFEKHKTRRVIVAKQAQQQLDEFGYLAEYRTVIYTLRYFYPRPKDLYLETEWDCRWEDIEHYGKPTNLIKAYQVDDTVAYAQNSITYYGSRADTYDFDFSLINGWLRDLGEVWVPPRKDW
jgi:hypothetical protein